MNFAELMPRYMSDSCVAAVSLLPTFTDCKHNFVSSLVYLSSYPDNIPGSISHPYSIFGRFRVPHVYD